MSFLYPLTPVVEKISTDIIESLNKNHYDRLQFKDLTKYIEFVGDELSVNSDLIDFKEASGFKNPTIELTFKKIYMTIDELVFLKHWTCYPDVNSEVYFKITTEMLALLRRLKIRPVD